MTKHRADLKILKLGMKTDPHVYSTSWTTADADQAGVAG